MLSGSFAPGSTGADVADFTNTVKPYSDDAQLAESDPPQFFIHGIVGGCEQLRAELQGKAYIANVGTCLVEHDSGADGDEPVSSP
jgi:hypothetical protein